jgi:hypothetical protein
LKQFSKQPEGAESELGVLHRILGNRSLGEAFSLMLNIAVLLALLRIRAILGREAGFLQVFRGCF